jgi:hypothetical protein
MFILMKSSKFLIESILQKGSTLNGSQSCRTLLNTVLCRTAVEMVQNANIKKNNNYVK